MLGLAVVVGLLAANALFCAAEFAFVAVDRTRVDLDAAGGDKKAGRLQRMLPHLNFYLSGAQLGITITSIGLGFVAQPFIAEAISPIFEPFFGESATRGISLVVALTLATVLQLVLAEVVPKNVAVSRPESTGRALARFLRVFSAVLGPLIRFLNATAVSLVRRLGVEPREELESFSSVEELAVLIRSSGEHGSLGADATRLLTRSLQFGDKEASEVLVPRTSLVALAHSASIADLAAAAVTSGYSRFPVYGTDLDDVLGVALAKDAVGVPPPLRPSTPVTTVMVPIPAVPATAPLDDLLADMRSSGRQLVLVVDEYGGTAGIVTLEDLLEEIVGEIEDEYDEPDLTPPAAPGTAVLDGGLHPREVEDACGLVLPDGDYETLAGFLLHRLGRVPAVGDTLTWQGWTLEVVEMDRRRVARVRVEQPVGRTEP